MFDIFKRGWDIICGPAQDRPLRSADLAGFVTAQDRPLRAAEHGVAIFKMKLMSRHFSWLEVETVLRLGGFAIAKVETVQGK